MGTKLRLAGSLAEQAYRAIRERILRGQFPLGAPLSRRGLAADFGMSFLPITEAIKRLEEEGLVESRPRVGTRVRIPTAQDVRERCIIREALEAQSARLFSEKASSAERMELRTMAVLLDNMSDECAAAPADGQRRFRTQMLHLSFHMRIAECTGCAALCKALDKNQLLIFNWLYDVATDHQTPPRWHQELIEAVAGFDPEAADRAMRGHVRLGLGEIQTEIARRFTPHSALSEVERPLRVSPPNGTAWRAKAGAPQGPV
jgi:DNA-binding GntR family transcriptional regulator